MCYIFLERSCKIQFNGHAKKSHVTSVTCQMSQMLHVTNIKLPRILPNTPCVIHFWKPLAKSRSMVMQKTSQVTCGRCHMSQILHLTNIMLTIILPKTPCVIYFWKVDAKSSSMAMQKCHMSHVLYVTCHQCYMSQM